jgi:hypothetical protein
MKTKQRKNLSMENSARKPQSTAQPQNQQQWHSLQMRCQQQTWEPLAMKPRELQTIQK